MNVSPLIGLLGLRWGELLISLIITLVPCGLFIALMVVMAIKAVRQKTASQSPAASPEPPHQTKPACPQCGAEIQPGAPGNLCPRCLMRAGFGTQYGYPDAQAKSPPKAPSELAPFFPNLEILEVLGQGGMGTVYKARQPQLDRYVALKILAPELSRDPAFAERFSREAKAMARLNHPNIVAVYDSGQAGEFFFLIMEYVDGLNLWQMEQGKKRLSPEEALAIVPTICDALQYAHNEGIVHRDIKPANILIDTKGRVKIADFGLAKLVGRESMLGLTQSHATMGTPQYMAPEQIEKPLAVDHRADIYSLGVVFYEMLTGELPMGRFAPPSAKVQMDVRLDEVVLRSLEKEPERRYQQAGQVKTAVETIVSTPGGAAPSAAPNPPGAGDSAAPPLISSQPPASLAPQTAPISDAVRRRVKQPAVALMVLGVLNLVLSAGGLALLGLASLVAGVLSSTLRTKSLFVFGPWGLLILMLLSVFMIVAGRKMKEFEAYPLAIAACVLAIVFPPFDLLIIGAAIGIWGLVVLLNAEVREAFNRKRAASNKPPVSIIPGVIAALLAVLLLAAIALALLFVCERREVRNFQNQIAMSAPSVNMAPMPAPARMDPSIIDMQDGEMSVTPAQANNAISFFSNEKPFVALPDAPGKRVEAVRQIHKEGKLALLHVIADPRSGHIFFVDSLAVEIPASTADSIHPESAPVIISGEAQPGVIDFPISIAPCAYVIKTCRILPDDGKPIRYEGVVEVTGFISDNSISVRYRICKRQDPIPDLAHPPSLVSPIAPQSPVAPVAPVQPMQPELPVH